MAVVGRNIRLMIVDDSAVVRHFLKNGLAIYPNIQVVAIATNAQDAIEKVKELKPDVITLDIEMPGMSGIDLLREVLRPMRIPVILVSSLNVNVLDALDAGAMDVVRKPFGRQDNDQFFQILGRKIISAAGVRPQIPVTHAQPVQRAVVAPSAATPLTASGMLTKEPVIIGLGASTGGTEATLEVMRRLPADIPGMVIVQHMPVGFTKMYAERLNRLCQMEVREAVDGDEIRPGLALVAPADFQSRVIRSGGRYLLTCKEGEKVSGHRPSVDALFLSMAEKVACRMVGIILTGMGRDGANGLLAMRQAGAYTIGQDKESSVVYGMPMVAHEIGAVQIQAPCEHIAGILIKHLKRP